MISVSFRFDDPSPTSDHALERRLIKILAYNKVNASFAVVPFRISKSNQLLEWDTESARHLTEAQQAGIIEVAQHGKTHTRVSHTANGAPSEFHGIPLQMQISAISHGLAHLRSIFGDTIKGFVPPWNTYDNLTAQAVNSLGLGYLSASWEIYRSGKLPIIPRTCNLRSARSAIEASLRFQQLDPAVVIVLHPDDFEEFIYPPTADEPPPFTNLKEFEALVRWIVAKENIEVVKLSRLAERIVSKSPLWCYENVSWLRHLPFRLQSHFPRGILIRKNRLIAIAQVIKTAVNV